MKDKKAYEYLAKSGAEISSTPTRAVCLVNAGNQQGIAVDDFEAACSLLGKIAYLLNFPGKTYCVVIYEGLECAIDAHKALAGRACTLLKRTYSKEASIPLLVEYLIEDSIQLPVPATVQDARAVPGLVVVENFITAEEESTLKQCLDRYKWEPLSRRRVQHHGIRFNYSTNRHADDSMPGFPQEVQDIIIGKLRRMKSLNPVDEVSPVEPVPVPDQLTVNEYKPGAGISAHVDTHSPFRGAIISVSLCGRVVMEFKHRDGRAMSVLVPARSLVAFTGEVRYDWTHAITETRFDYVDNSFRERQFRISLTFRETKSTPCDCNYPHLCDSVGSTQL
ncbi:hypothetical protein SARC_00350 [Sphaeroforma arctica JP610]|uniref:Fe2OG dioxygenase domain-containing protein n=1 Tax=Sphaeroforma arctica JP610 TaxID=667725 RepID=A0A0L0GF86_9EUKA|nr:hypothetical protein SARC_00350 [Sphaeroforma arctica JP610]KNC87526.1 hypothetical protein SARC_00350 [Sphaeroforma arctica JP610]|eukprot:XP_014161428.1 hypothetical protein SARC_00350 [Sphaeroforma arctica JP610]